LPRAVQADGGRAAFTLIGAGGRTRGRL